MIRFGREIAGVLDLAERREWLCTNGVGGSGSGRVAGSLSRRYHGLLVAALHPPLGRTLFAAKLDETAVYDGVARALATNRWADGAVDPQGFREIESFHLDGTTPVWVYAVGDALVEKRVWMEQGANTTYVRYCLLRGRVPVALELKALVNHRDLHAVTRGPGWRMAVPPLNHGLGVGRFEGAPLGRRGRRDDDRRRLSLVRRLGSRHDDRARRAHARDRTRRGRAAHPHDVGALRGPRPAAEPVPRRRRRARVQHGGRDALVRGGDPGLPRGERRRRAPAGALPPPRGCRPPAPGRHAPRHQGGPRRRAARGGRAPRPAHLDGPDGRPAGGDAAAPPPGAGA